MASKTCHAEAQDIGPIALPFETSIGKLTHRCRAKKQAVPPMLVLPEGPISIHVAICQFVVDRGSLRGVVESMEA
jgi:hypothetical protein